MSDDDKELIERLRDQNYRLREEVSRLRFENARLTLDRDRAEFRVENELKPMIASKEHAYDQWATSPEGGR